MTKKRRRSILSIKVIIVARNLMSNLINQPISTEVQS